MTRHPYDGQPDYAKWSRGVRGVAPGHVDPAVGFPWQLEPSDLVATAGSCFAQHIARHLSASGFHYWVVEAGHPVATPAIAREFNYGVFSARYGNIYTARQLLQLFDRVYGRLVADDDIWEENGRFFDPYRPSIEPGGYSSEPEYRYDRQRHYHCVRTMFENLDTFVFTLGLTECWENRHDGVVYPTCPGTIAGTFDANRHAFRNLTVDDVIGDLTQFLARLAEVNPRARVILTVSPVPLAATALDRHVLTSTTYSKSVLRVAAETIVQRHPNVAYFPSYEIITGNFSRGGYYADNLRDVTEEGVSHVMRLFMQHATVDGPAPAPAPVVEDTFFRAMKNVVEVLCDEAALDAAP